MMADTDTTTERGRSIGTETTVDPETIGPEEDDPFDVPTPGGLRGLV